ncbi:MAG: hypothetical protein ACHQ5A_11155, partial [Opitutales bacterium]
MLVWPPDQSASSPELDALRAHRARLAPATDLRWRTAQERESVLRQQLWTAATFAYWRKNSLPPGWTVQDLGPAELKFARARRFALQRPAATSSQWPEITALLADLEARECTRVQTVSLAARPGYAGSRSFSQCVLVVLLAFADEPPGRG